MPVLRLADGCQPTFEIVGANVNNTTVDWRIVAPDGRLVLLDVKYRDSISSANLIGSPTVARHLSQFTIMDYCFEVSRTSLRCRMRMLRFKGYGSPQTSSRSAANWRTPSTGLTAPRCTLPYLETLSVTDMYWCAERRIEPVSCAYLT